MRHILAVLLLAAVPVAAQEPTHFTGLWEARRDFGPDVRGTLMIWRQRGEFRAEIAGRSVLSTAKGDDIAFELATGEGRFEGKLRPKTGRIEGHWVQPPSRVHGFRFATPVTLVSDGPDRWRGEVRPLDDSATYYLKISPRPDGTFGAIMKNPDRNIGRQWRVDRFADDGDTVRLYSADGRELTSGPDQGDNFSMGIRGATYDFGPVNPAGTDFYPRLKETAVYAYERPPALDDGWSTGTLEEAGISREGISRLIQQVVNTPIDSTSAPEMHALLIARNGKLVLEEYFHGHHREKLHEMRSSSKSITGLLAGAAMLDGAKITANTPVYSAFEGESSARALEPRRRTMTLEHLLTMSAGLDCDDSDRNSPGHEDIIAEQEAEPDWYRYTWKLGMIREPGSKAVYCSCNTNLAGAVISKGANRRLLDLFRDLLAEPLEIKRYAVNVQPTGEAYMGGGMRLLPRDYLKLSQLVVNGGTWKNRRVISAEWCRQMITRRYEMGTQGYGYTWWTVDYPYRGGKVRAVFAAGNGGQISMAIPELGLAIASFGGNYADPVARKLTDDYVPNHILPAVEPLGLRKQAATR